MRAILIVLALAGCTTNDPRYTCQVIERCNGATTMMEVSADTISEIQTEERAALNACLDACPAAIDYPGNGPGDSCTVECHDAR